MYPFDDPYYVRMVQANGSGTWTFFGWFQIFPESGVVQIKEQGEPERWYSPHTWDVISRVDGPNG